ncbi:MAG TPA: vitamin B12 dependent-methionine synthase activation domain-containing protein, partial [Ilumatobacteraceae bacterium]|nr:vitamin B12 dependent-methionine synthase activation domain-containing protein [Ilumatobacteraceae bacterium]
IDSEYARVVEAHQRAEVERQRLTIEAARANAGDFRFDASTVVAPSYLGARTVEVADLATLAEYIDWTPFFHAWGLRGRFPAILDDAELGEAARPLWDDARQMLDRIVA